MYYVLISTNMENLFYYISRSKSKKDWKNKEQFLEPHMQHTLLSFRSLKSAYKWCNANKNKNPFHLHHTYRYHNSLR